MLKKASLLPCFDSIFTWIKMEEKGDTKATLGSSMIIRYFT